MPTTFYLKYRPQNFGELDHVEARQELTKIFSSKKFPHAFLFSGPKGIGKTSAARIVAKAVNCEKISDKIYEPCNECGNCRSITQGSNVDIIEIDAASNRGIDDIKELREKIKLSPASLKYKVYIIDEVHMLTPEAFNALLKTLEEPPKHAIFVLCTTDLEKLPKTIVSRCQRINFKKATKTEIVSRLKKICESEKLEYEEKALEEIVKLSEGSFRDGAKVLEQISLSGKVTLEEVQRTAGIFGEYSPAEFLSILEKEEVKTALEWIGRAVEGGVNLKILLENILNIFRNLLLASCGVKQEEVFDYSFTEGELKKLIYLFSEAFSQLKTAVIPQLPVEMAVIEWSRTGGKKETAKNPEKRIASHLSQITLGVVLSKWPEILEKVRPLNHSVLAFLRATRPISVEDDFLVLEVFYKFHKEQLEKDQCRRIFELAASEVLSCPVKLKCLLGEKPLIRKVETEVPPAEVKTEVKIQAENLNDSDIIKIAEEIFNGKGVIQ